MLEKLLARNEVKTYLSHLLYEAYMNSVVLEKNKQAFIFPAIFFKWPLTISMTLVLHSLLQLPFVNLFLRCTFQPVSPLASR